MISPDDSTAPLSHAEQLRYARHLSLPGNRICGSAAVAAGQCIGDRRGGSGIASLVVSGGGLDWAVGDY